MKVTARNTEPGRPNLVASSPFSQNPGHHGNVITYSVPSKHRLDGYRSKQNKPSKSGGRQGFHETPNPEVEVVPPVEPHACSFRHCSPATLRAPATRIQSPTLGCKVRQLGWTNPTLLLKKLSEGLQPEPQGNSTATSPKQPPFHRACLASVLTCSPG
jgi:hypothetical protein